jgi:hypothetical protein
MDIASQPCQELCTDIASVATSPVQIIGVCDYTVSNPLEDVTVTGCTIQEAAASPISDSQVLVSTNVTVEFTAVEGSGSAPFSAQCETHMSVVVTVINPPATLSEHLPCTPTLTCAARYAGFEPQLTPEIGAEEFIITVTGMVSCPNCQPAVVNVQLCPTAG